MSISTSLPQIEPATPPAQPLRRLQRRRKRFGRASLVAIGLTLLVLLVSAGAYLAYENTLPTIVTSNFKNGQKDVPTDGRFLLSFTRPVSLATVQAAFSINPVTDGAITEVSGQTQYVWTPAKPLAELTTYTVILKPIYDVGHHRVAGTQWTFTTIIVPRITSVTGLGGANLKDGDEIDPGWTLTLTFNDAMEPSSIKVLLGSQPGALKWAADDRSVTVSTVGIPAGPLTVEMAAGGRDQSGHFVPGAFTLKTGIYYHDREATTALKYPALIQIPNDEFALDQNGLQAASMVFEYLAEGGITRLTAIYQDAPNLIGPMRSARFISLKLGRHYEGLLFQSGESQVTAARERSDPTPQFFDTIGYQFRTAARVAPDNLMMRGTTVRAAEQNYFARLPAFTLAKSRPTNLPTGSAGSRVSVAEHYSVYTYDPVTGTYTKSEEGHAYKDASLNQPLRIEMLIVLHTTETIAGSDGHGSYIHDFDLDTHGAIQVFYEGQGYAGTWTSTSSHAPLTFTLSNGQVLALPPGLVWVDVTQ